MKKMIALATMAAMVVSMTACGSKAETATTEAPATEAATETAATEAEAATEAPAANGTLVMATNAEFPPYEYREGDKIVGIDADIAQAIADELGMELQIEDMAFDSIIAAVQSGKADFGAAGMTVTEDRLQAVNFTDTYTQASQVIIVKEGSTVATPDDLKGKRVGVQLGTTGDIYAEDIEDVTLDRYNKGFEAVQALLQDKLDAVIIDSEPAKVFVDENEGLKILDESFTDEEYAICMAKDNTDLLDKVNTALASLKESGKLDEIKAKYISAE
ncbi:MAG: basic amino acid ABC transporter substrate-binding protein [Lachnospiraceae bacterium]|nr:basic amino acid ABC transporter substrate-binding protein [Lachnospiraceae bacterium]